MTARRPRVLAISSRGGHWVQLRRLARAFEGCETVWASTDAALKPCVGGDRFVTVPDATRWNLLRVAYSALVVLLVLLRVRPDVVVSTGAAPGLLALRLGRLLRMRTVWIDSLANAETLS
ncbi:MAG: UDP-N-acetylglucosamine--LPS N-acetylglucosamine transferase, partial [Phycisphaerales bacterium]